MILASVDVAPVVYRGRLNPVPKEAKCGDERATNTVPHLLDDLSTSGLIYSSFRSTLSPQS
jgi:hypothetical protein